MSQILFAAEVALGRLEGRMPEEHLDLLETASGLAAQPRAGPPQVVRREREAVEGRVVPHDPQHRRSGQPHLVRDELERIAPDLSAPGPNRQGRKEERLMSKS